MTTIELPIIYFDGLYWFIALLAAILIYAAFRVFMSFWPGS